jgi:hypothetical protein
LKGEEDSEGTRTKEKEIWILKVNENRSAFHEDEGKKRNIIKFGLRLRKC